MRNIPEPAQPSEEAIRGELHRLRLNILRRERAIPRLLKQAQEKKIGMDSMKNRQRHLQRQLEQLLKGNHDSMETDG